VTDSFDPIFRFPAVLQLTGLSRSKVRELIACGAFPKPIKLGGRAIGFLQSELVAWQREQVRGRAKT
jgi:prophage regulatory protein